MRTKRGAYLFVVMLTGLTPARAAAQTTGTVVRAIQVVEENGITHVTIEADGPLPLPMSESLTNPPRIYFDLPAVTHKIRGTTLTSGVVSRVRVALRPGSPPVTRVVLDLTRLESYRADADETKAGRIRVRIGPESVLDSVPTPSRAVPSPAAPAPANTSSTSVAPARIAGIPAPPVSAGNATPATVESPATALPRPPPTIARPSPAPRSPVLSPQLPRAPLPVNEVQVYRKQVFRELARMEELRALITRIDAGETVNSDALSQAAQEFTDLRRSLEAVQPSAVLAVVHDLLMTSCTFGAMASRLALEAAQPNNPDARRSAASAAAGSLMLFDRACADLGCTKAPR